MIRYALSEPLIYGMQFSTDQELQTAISELKDDLGSIRLEWRKDVQREEYDNAVLDLRFENGRWRQ